MKLVEGELEILNETNNVEGRKIRGVETNGMRNLRL